MELLRETDNKCTSYNEVPFGTNGTFCMLGICRSRKQIKHRGFREKTSIAVTKCCKKYVPINIFLFLKNKCHVFRFSVHI